MKYWLHRISHLQNVSYPLLEKGYLSIGFSDFCTDEFFDCVVIQHDRRYMEKDFQGYWGFIPRTRFDLWRFLVEMKKGDYVIVPGQRTFSVFEICEDLPIKISDSTIMLPETDRNGIKILRNETGQRLILDKNNQKLDIGFLRKVKPIYKDISRSNFADANLTARMKIRNTNADISDLENSIQKAIQAFAQNSPINLKAMIIDKSIDIWNNIIMNEISPEKYEELVRWYFEKVGASKSEIPSKNLIDKVGDVDVFAVFDSIKTIIYVQVKKHTGQTSEWAINQIKDFAKSRENVSDGYNRQYWVISSCDSFSKESCNLAEENGILLIDGKQFIKMILDAGIDTLNI